MSQEDLPDELSGHGERSGVLSRLVRLNRYLLLLLLIPLGIIYFKPPYAEQQEAQRRLDELTLQRDATKEKAARLKRKLDLIRNDDEYLEAMARDRLHLQKDGEIIVRFDR